MAIARQPGRRRSPVAVRALATTGLVASAAIGMGAATVGPAGANTPAKIYACYSDTTDALSYLNYPTVTTCPSGSSRISWNVTGAQGAQGAQGSTGSKGAQGAAGAQGARGSTGSKGPQGTAGAQGAEGVPGAQGATGSKGAQGGPGAQGAAGAQGAVGPTGSKGVQGATGAQGAPGAQGAAGATGPKGSPGPQGFRGSPGAPGANGAVTLYSQKVSSSLAEYSGGVSQVVGTISALPGYYAVNVDATVRAQYGGAQCRAVDHSSRSGDSTSPTNRAFQPPGAGYVTLPMTGGMFVAPGSTIEVDCLASQARSSQGSAENVLFVRDLAITATQVNSRQGGPEHATRVRAKPLNSFMKSLPPLSRADKLPRRR
jgi:hypothetical protein